MNPALVKLLAKRLGIPKSAITIITGTSARHEVLLISTDDPQMIVRKLSGGG